MNIQRILVALPVLLLTGGCATAAAHMNSTPARSPQMSGVYRGVKFHTFIWKSMMTTGPDPQTVPTLVLFAPVFICDFPLSAVADTLCLPFDAISNNSTNSP
jgi:uncharacterized protein YceK